MFSGTGNDVDDQCFVTSSCRPAKPWGSFALCSSFFFPFSPAPLLLLPFFFSFFFLSAPKRSLHLADFIWCCSHPFVPVSDEFSCQSSVEACVVDLIYKAVPVSFSSPTTNGCTFWPDRAPRIADKAPVYPSFKGALKPFIGPGKGLHPFAGRGEGGGVSGWWWLGAARESYH